MIDDDLINQLMRHEGLRLKPYRCTANKLTIGVGRNLEDKGISVDEAMHLLKNDVRDCWIDLENFNDKLISELSLTRQYVLVNMCFNLGINRLKGFKKMWAALERHDYDEAAKEMLDSKWSTDVGERSFELAEQMRSGIF